MNRLEKLMRRRSLAGIAGYALSAAALSGSSAARAESQGTGADIEAALAQFKALPGTTSYRIDVMNGRGNRTLSHNTGKRLFVGSAIKTFILARYLQDVETKRLDELEQCAIDDSVRSFDSAVFAHLTGTASARTVLEAMISHSDNTATDVALLRVGPDRVRSFIASAGLTQTQIANSTRRLISYLAGAPLGVDIGWQGLQKVAAGQLPGAPRPALNDVQTMASSADDMVSYYQRALRGAFFQRPETLTEFKRILAMADAIALVVPPDTVAWAKGGSIDWDDFHCICVPGQMLAGDSAITFCLIVNWHGPDSSTPAAVGKIKVAVTDVLAAVKRSVG